MSIQNYMFQTRNAIFRVLEASQVNAEVVMNRGHAAVYPHILIDTTRKKALPNGQKELITDLYVMTKDLSIISASTILESIETEINQKAMQMYTDYYSLHFADVADSSIFSNEEGLFCGKVSVVCVLDEK